MEKIKIDYSNLIHRHPIILILRHIDPLVARLVCKKALEDHIIDQRFKLVQTVFLQNLFHTNSFESIRLDEKAIIIYWDKKSIAANRITMRTTPTRFNVGWSFILNNGKKFWISFHRHNPHNPPTWKDGEGILIYMYYYANIVHCSLCIS